MELTDRFNAKNSELLQEAQGNEKALHAIRVIDERRIELTQKLELHCQNHRLQWITQQAMKLQEQQKEQLQYSVPTPSGALAHHNGWNHRVLQATQMVDARIEERLQTLESISRRMQSNAIELILIDQKNRELAKQQLDQEVKEIHHETHLQRMDAYRDFEEHKTQRVEEARQNHSQTPERDVYEDYKQQDKDILMKKELLLKQAHEKNGFNYENEQHSLTQQYNHKM
jgi:hypothetical protein